MASSDSMKCHNPNCVGGYEKQAVLLDTPQELYLLAKHFPNGKPHISEKRVLCRTCNPPLRRALSGN